MASLAIKGDRQDCESRTTSKSASTSGSESSSTEEEERLRRLFQTCDRDGDGYIDSHDLAQMCHRLNMEDAVEEIMEQLGADDTGRISFDEFLHCRMRLVTEIEQERLKDRGLMHLHPNMMPPWNNSTTSMNNRQETVDLDSNNLYKLMEEHDPEALQRMVEIADTLQGEQGGSNFLDVANSLHLAALTSLKGEILDLSNRLQHVTTEKELLEKQLNKQQSEKLRIQREAEDRVEQTTVRYEERITELHSVIAELRKKIDRNQINVIREEEEFEELDDKYEEKSADDAASLNENNANESRSESVADITTDLNVELSRVVSELESALERRPGTCEINNDVFREPLSTADNEIMNDKTMQVVKDMEKLSFTPPVPPRTTDLHKMEADMMVLREEHGELQCQVGRQETDINKLRAQLGSIREERDRLKRKVRELQTRLQSIEASSSPHNSRTSTPTKAQAINPTTGERTISVSSTEQVTPPVAKIAGMRKLRTGGPERQVLGAEISSVGLPNAKVAEHLVQNLQECSNVQEISQTLSQSGNRVSDSKIRDFEVELERLTSKIDHLKSQNDLLTLTLEESKAQCDRLTVLMGKYESNNTALQLAINFSDQALEAYDILVTLLESEQGVLLANCRAAGLGSGIGNTDCHEVDDQQEVTGILQKAHLARKGAEHGAKQLLHRLDRSINGVHNMTSCATSPWEDLSSNSHTTSTTSSTASSSDTEFSKLDEQKLRDHIQQLKNDRASVKMTVMELESIHIDPLADSTTNPDAQRLDLENAVLMQELMAMKEEKAELKSQNYLLEKEKSAVELQLSGKQSQEQAYMVQIEHLKCEISDQQRKITRSSKKEEYQDLITPAITLAELRSHDTSQIAQDLAESMKRKKKKVPTATLR